MRLRLLMKSISLFVRNATSQLSSFRQWSDSISFSSSVGNLGYSSFIIPPHAMYQIWYSPYRHCYECYSTIYPYHHLHYLLFPDLNIADNKHIISQIPIATDHLNFNPKQIVISFIIPHVTTRLNAQVISNKTIVNIITDNVFLLFINSLLII